MSEPLLSISAYARATSLPTSALRYYDEIGLLRPDHVDQSSGYRYYSSATVETAKVVSVLRGSGVPVDVMRSVLEKPRHDAATTLRSLAAEQRDANARATRDLEALAARLDNRTTAGMLTVDGPVLADALRAATNQCGLAMPWDRIVLAAEPSGLDIVATNTFSMFCHQGLATSDGYGRVAISRSAVWELVDWLEHRSTCGIDFSKPAIIQSGNDPFTAGMTDASDYTDHIGLLPPNLTLCTRISIDRGLARAALMEAGTDVISLAVEDGMARLAGVSVGHPIGSHGREHFRLSRHLLDAALRALPGTSVRLDLGPSRRPCLLRSTVQPHRMVVLMPARG